MRILEFLEDHEKKLSKERLQTLISALIAFTFVLVKGFGKGLDANDLWVVGILLTYSFGAKSFQNITETMGKNRKPNKA